VNLSFNSRRGTGFARKDYRSIRFVRFESKGARYMPAEYTRNVTEEKKSALDTEVVPLNPIRNTIRMAMNMRRMAGAKRQTTILLQRKAI
jgi:hypothetical protein